MDLSKLRRVVTGHDEAGNSMVLMDGPPPILRVANTGGGMAQVWATDSTPADNSGSADASVREVKLMAPPGGTLLWMVNMAPSGKASAQELERRARATVQEMGGAHISTASKRPDMHATNTVDYVIVLSGEVTLILDNGETTLRQYDMAIQRGTNHTWENRGKETATIAFVLIDAKPLPHAQAH